MLKIVVIKLMAPRIEDAPAKCMERITMSTAGPPCPEVESGAYKVHPGPAPPSTKPEPINSIMRALITKNLSCSFSETPCQEHL